jgi:hypothetical protein
MTHDCRIYYLETSEDHEGYLYLQWTKPFGFIEKFKVEYCPVCGMRSKKSSLENLTMFIKDELAESQLEDMHNIIMKNFLDTCRILAEEKLEDHTFQFCLNTIQNALRYASEQRKEKKRK